MTVDVSNVTRSGTEPYRFESLRSRASQSRWIKVFLGFVAVPFLLVIIGVYIPAIDSVRISLTKWDGISLPRFAGLANYVAMVHDPIFLEAFKNTAIWLVLFGGLSVTVGLAIALLLRKPMLGVGWYRSAIYLPLVFSMTITGLFWGALYQPGGAIDHLFYLVGARGLVTQWFNNPDTALYAILVPAIWAQVGYTMVLYLAGMQAMDPALEEASQVDGASAWQRLRFIVLPQLRGVNMIVFAITVISSLRTFDVVMATTGGGPFNSSQLLSTYMFQETFTSQNLGYGAALGTVIFVLAVGFIVLYLMRSFKQVER